MKILAAGDLHGDITLARKLAQQAADEQVDLVLLCGDLVAGEDKTEGIVGPFAEQGKDILLLPGNHESEATIDFLSMQYGAKNLHGNTHVTEDVGFFGCGGATFGLTPVSESETFALLQQGHTHVKEKQVKVMVTHVPPEGAKMEQLSRFVGGSSGVRKAVQTFQPDVLLCSHIHEADGVEEDMGKTRVINVGKKGKIVDL